MPYPVVVDEEIETNPDISDLTLDYVYDPQLDNPIYSQTEGTPKIAKRQNEDDEDYLLSQINLDSKSQTPKSFTQSSKENNGKKPKT